MNKYKLTNNIQTNKQIYGTYDGNIPDHSTCYSVDTEIISLCDFLMHSCQGLIPKEKPFIYYGYTELLQKFSSSITQTPGRVPGTYIELVMSH